MWGISRRRLVRAFLFGIVGSVVGVAATSAIAVVQRNWKNPVALVAAAVFAGLTGVIALLQEERTKEEPPVPAPPEPGPVAPPRPEAVRGPVAPPRPKIVPSRKRPRRSWRPRTLREVGGLLFMLAEVTVLVSGCTYAAASATRTFVHTLVLDQAARNEPRGTSVLRAGPTATPSTLSITVTVVGVEVTPHLTWVRLKVVSHRADLIGLGDPQYYTLVDQDGRALSAFTDPDFSWAENISPGATVSGSIAFEGRLSHTATTLSLRLGAATVDGIAVTVP